MSEREEVHARNWLEYNTDAELSITPDTTDREIWSIAIDEEINASIEQDIEMFGTYEYLLYRRDLAREKRNNDDGS